MDMHSGFYELYLRYNQTRVDIQDFDTFMLDLRDIAHTATTRAELEKRLNARRQQRLDEINECIDAVSAFATIYNTEMEDAFNATLGQDTLHPRVQWWPMLMRFFREHDVSSLARFLGTVYEAAPKTAHEMRVWEEKVESQWCRAAEEEGTKGIQERDRVTVIESDTPPPAAATPATARAETPLQNPTPSPSLNATPVPPQTKGPTSPCSQDPPTPAPTEPKPADTDTDGDSVPAEGDKPGPKAKEYDTQHTSPDGSCSGCNEARPSALSMPQRKRGRSDDDEGGDSWLEDLPSPPSSDESRDELGARRTKKLRFEYLTRQEEEAAWLQWEADRQQQAGA